MLDRLIAARRLAEAHWQKDAAIEAQEFERAAMWRDVERRLRSGGSVSWPPAIVQAPRPWPLHGFIWKYRAAFLAGAFLLGFGIVVGRLIWG